MFWNIILGLALLIIGYVIMPKPAAQKPAEVTEMDGPTSQAGRPIPVLFGDITMKSPNFLWWGDKYYKKEKQRVSKK